MRLLSRAVLAVSLATLTGAALAAAPATGLGQAWPNATDVSTNPHFHVYVFALGGINYIQVNDANGNVLGSVGTGGGQFITLPIGRFAQQVTTPSQPAAAPTTAAATANPTNVYNDGQTTLTVTPLSDGTMRLNAVAAQGTCDPIDCNIKGIQAQGGAPTSLKAVTPQGTCDPIECNIKGIQSLGGGTMRLNVATPQGTCDPIECNIKGNQ
jgi:hypothetical protein|nr:hypothetical protein [Dyella sp. ASV24]